MRWAVIEYHTKKRHAPEVILNGVHGPFRDRAEAIKYAVEVVEPTQDPGWDWDVAKVAEDAYEEHARTRPAHPDTMIGRVG